jgi:uncharacterized protein YdaU (DUF1376 family)
MARKPDAPYFPFLVRDWLSGQGTSRMSAEQCGGFINLLAHAWLSNPPCHLRDDADLLADLAKIGRKRWAKVGPLIREQFDQTSTGQVFNRKQLELWTHMVRVSSSRKSSGKLGGRPKKTLRNQPGDETNRIPSRNQTVIKKKRSSDTDADTETDNKEPRKTPPPADLLSDSGPDQVDALVTLWNTERRPGPKVTMPMPAKRRQHLAAAMRESPNLDVWRQVIRWLNDQAFANAPGAGHQFPDWRATLDWLAKPGKLAEYQERVRLDATRKTDRKASEEEQAARLAEEEAAHRRWVAEHAEDIARSERAIRDKEALELAELQAQAMNLNLKAAVN